MVHSITRSVSATSFLRSLLSLMPVSITLVSCGSVFTLPVSPNRSSSSKGASSTGGSSENQGEDSTGAAHHRGQRSDVVKSSPGQGTCGVQRHSFRSTGHPAIPADLRPTQLVVIFRHGDRAPVSKSLGTILDEGEESTSLWLSKLPSSGEAETWDKAFPPRVLGDSCGQTIEEIVSSNPPWGELTVRGAEELRDLGGILREHVVAGNNAALFPSGPETEASSIYVRTTAIRRTQHSAQNLLLGLGLSGDVDLHVRPRTRETLWPTKNHRRRQEELIDQASQENEWPNHADLKTTTSKMLGVREEDIKWSTVREVVTCYEAHGVPLPPDAISSGFVQSVSDYAAWMWGTWFRGKEMARLSIGPFLEELLSVIGARGQEDGIPEANIATRPKLAIFSGHDNTIVPILCALKIYDDTWPPYASYIGLDMADDRNGRKLVRVVFNSQEVVLPGASGPWIPLADLHERLEDLMPEPEDLVGGDSGAGGISNGSSEISATIGGGKD
ncbi:unnamed protein product [Ascophyllum nodosum]